MADKKTKPVKTFKSSNGKINVSIWANKSKKNGQTTVRYSVKLEKQFKDGDNWKKTDYFFPEELRELQSLLRKARNSIRVRAKQETESFPV